MRDKIHNWFKSFILTIQNDIIKHFNIDCIWATGDFVDYYFSNFDAIKLACSNELIKLKWTVLTIFSICYLWFNPDVNLPTNTIYQSFSREFNLETGLDIKEVYKELNDFVAYYYNSIFEVMKTSSYRVPFGRSCAKDSLPKLGKEGEKLQNIMEKYLVIFVE